jgi:DNA modification methylase
VNQIFTGECREVMRRLIADGVKAQCVVTSPPYWGLRSYGTPAVEWADGWRGELGLEPSVFQYIDHMLEVFDLVREVLANDGVCFLNIGDTYITRPNGGIGENSTINGQGSQIAAREARVRMGRRNRGPLKMKDMALVPQRLAIALQESGWWVRQDIIWAKTNPMPGSYEDRFTTSHEYVWLLAKSERYYFDGEAVKEPSSPNSHARMARAHGGYAAPGQDPHGGILAPRGNAGVNPKARSRKPAGWATGDGSHKDLIGRYPNPKQNDSFSAAVVDLVGMRRKRDVWPLPTTPYSGSHYATFPEALVEPCILSGTSAHGHCPKCGAGWVRVMGEPLPAEGPGSGNKERKDRSEHGGIPVSHQNQAFGVPWQPTVPVTIGWTPSCDCSIRFSCADVCVLQPVPAVVFDPFIGTGTVATVATRLGRHYLGCDLDTKNEQLQHDRLTGQTMGLALA